MDPITINMNINKWKKMHSPCFVLLNSLDEADALVINLKYDNQRARLGANVWLLHYVLKVTSLRYGNNLSTHG